MNIKEKIALTKKNIWTAIEDYGHYTDLTSVLDDISSCFVDRLAEDSVYAKSALRVMFRKSPAWDEELDALVINGTRTHNPDYNLIDELANKITRHAYWNLPDDRHRALLDTALKLFKYPDAEPTEYIKALNELAPKAYVPKKKLSRIFMALCKELGVADETAGSEFQRLYAQFADELSAKKISFKLFVSLNPAHFLSMSNPKCDNRGSMLTSCHSFNTTDYEYNNGCSGYARDEVTMIAFTTSNPNESETLNNRKTSRQLFMYKPNNGLLLQSRMYNTNGGTRGVQAESKVYRDLIQREISECEGVPNLWKTFKYRGNEKDICFETGYGFGGYPDWQYSEFSAMVSIRNDHAEDYKTFKIGTYGLCIMCGEEHTYGVYCDECKNSNRGYCEECENDFDNDELYQVYSYNGSSIWVCEDCRDEYYTQCDRCGEWHHNESIAHAGNGDDICEDCRDANYTFCEDCEEYYPSEDMVTAINANGYEIPICEQCRMANYEECADCDNYVHTDNATHVHHHDEERNVCPNCLTDYKECEKCREWYHEDDLDKNGLCPDCAKKEDDAE